MGKKRGQTGGEKKNRARETEREVCEGLHEREIKSKWNNFYKSKPKSRGAKVQINKKRGGGEG
jgi:hypothetical protein